MVFKLVRTDTEEPCKIQLQPGVHLIGRGKFLDCDDKRVSRKHGELEVTEDAVSLKALHQNPCFYIKKGSDQTVVLKHNNTVSLTNGDKFGLLPDSVWYEVLLCRVDVACEGDNTQELEELQGIDTNSTTISSTIPLRESRTEERFLKFDINETLISERAQSPSLLPAETANFSQNAPNKQSTSTGKDELTETDQSVKVTAQDQNSTENEQHDNNNLDEGRLSPKRCLSPDNSTNVDNKRVKTEPDGDQHPMVDGDPVVKQEPEVKPDPDGVPQPGPSGDQGSASNATNGANDVNPGMPPSPDKPNAPLRERCMYGANCYRKNPLHKAQFAHPADADWGAGERGQCPRGAACRKRDPRHWRDHTHPPAAAPPPPPPPGQYRAPDSSKKTRAPQKVTKRKRNESGSANESEDDSPQTSLIVTGKRTRKPVKRPSYSGSEDEEKDPYGTDESDEWTPGSQIASQSQTQDF